ncbi:putative wd repeat-containing protein [Eutypa lata UCREL1]|uniref:Putative wd repeat-containing protein n=1 Tax=Eutypa lata (strain UCR-EL1) TaxID=1287681 RepID=M7T870_EUTLA|nr:putative wd repeat-containing protein [Eutypa lata UCREL1]
MSHELTSPGRRLHREHVLNPITALAFYTAEDGRVYILAGEDTDIKIYDVEHSRLCGQLPVFRAQSIHGIAVPPRVVVAPTTTPTSTRQAPQVLVWGGHSVTVLSGDLIEDAIHSKGDGFTHESSTAGGASPLVTAGEVKAPDWIFDGRISPFADDRVVLFTAHNEIIEARLGNCSHQGRRSLTFGEIRSPSRPILFSGNLSWISADCVLVAAGTVFGEILVWKCYLGTRERETEAVPAADCEVLFVFSGHEGSIFGVHISPEFQTASGEMMLVRLDSETVFNSRSTTTARLGVWR